MTGASHAHKIRAGDVPRTGARWTAPRSLLLKSIARTQLEAEDPVHIWGAAIHKYTWSHQELRAAARDRLRVLRGLLGGGR